MGAGAFGDEDLVPIDPGMPLVYFCLPRTWLNSGPWGRGLANHVAVMAVSARMSSPLVRIEKDMLV